MAQVLIIGATGTVGGETRSYLLDHSDHQLTLMARRTDSLNPINPDRERVIQGSVLDRICLTKALEGQDAVFAALSGDLPAMATSLVEAMEASAVRRLIFISSMGIYDEIPPSVGSEGNLSSNPMLKPYRKAADIIEASGLDYTIIRPGWFDHGDGGDYQITHKGEPFGGHDVAVSSIADLVLRLVNDPDLAIGESLGINRP